MAMINSKPMVRFSFRMVLLLVGRTKCITEVLWQGFPLGNPGGGKASYWFGGGGGGGGGRRSGSRWSRGRSLSCLGLDGEQLQIEDKRGVGPDRPLTAFAIGEVRWDVNLPFRSDGHKLQRLGPSLDDSGLWKGRGLPPLEGAINLGVVE